MLQERMEKVFAASGERTQAEFAAAIGVELERVKNLINGRVQRLKPDEARAIQQRYGWRESWLMEGKGAQRLTREEQTLLAGEKPPLPALRRATELLAQRGVTDHRAIDCAQQLYMAAARQDRDAMDGAMTGLLDLISRSPVPASAPLVARDSDGPVAAPSTTARTPAPYPPSDDFVYVAKYEVAASAGNGAVIHDEAVVDHLAFKRSWIAQTLGLDPMHLALIDARGDSMSPTIESGDLLLLDTRAGFARTEGIYVINLAGSLLVKRLRIKLSGEVDVMSDNSRYASETISGAALERLRMVGRVVWHGRKI